MSARAPREQIEALGRDLVTEILRAGRVELEAVRNAIGQPAKDDLQQTLIDLGRLVAREVHGEDVAGEKAIVRATLLRYAAVATLILARTADALEEQAWMMAGEFAGRAAEVLGAFARGLAIGAIGGGVA